MKRLMTILTLILATKFAYSQEIEATLKKISYTKDCLCSHENPVLVKVQFCSGYKNIEGLEIIVKNGRSIYSSKIKDYDDNGNIFYSYCSKIGETNDFEIYFRNAKGQKSETFEISATPENYNIK